MFHSGDDDEEEEPHDEDDADEQQHQVPEEESKVANQHRSSVDMTAHPQVIIACHHHLLDVLYRRPRRCFHICKSFDIIKLVVTTVKLPDSRFRRGAEFSEQE